ncbi:MAG: 30S ribosomal protein S3 [Candidatus Omnitrophota bacterium]
MGQKVHPVGFRLGFIRDWDSRWFAKKNVFGKILEEDVKIRNYVNKTLQTAGIAKVEIERAADKAKIIIFTSRPGIVIGRRGADIDRLRDEIQKITGKEIYIDIKEIKNPYREARLVAQNIAFQLEKRVSFRRAMKKAITQALSSGVEGVKVSCAGRLGGAEMKRTESYKEGKVPLHTLRADIDYGLVEANTTYGIIGVKVWLYKGDKKHKQYIEEKLGKAISA